MNADAAPSTTNIISPEKAIEVTIPTEIKPGNAEEQFNTDAGLRTNIVDGIQNSFLTLQTQSPVDLTVERTQIEKLRQELDELKEVTARTLGFRREDVSGGMQSFRAKRNIKYETPQGERFFAKYVTRQLGKRDTLAALKNEKSILDKISGSGVTPQAGELKIYPNGNKARLLMERVEGDSLDSERVTAENSFAARHKAEVIRSTANAHNIILQNGVAIVDVNEGTYVINQNPDGIQTKVVDFELACNLDDPTTEVLQSTVNWYRVKDFGFRTAGLNIENLSLDNLDVLRQADIHLWAKTMAEWILGPSDFWSDPSMSAAKQEEYQKASTQVKPIIEDQIRTSAKKGYQRLIAGGEPAWEGGEESYVNSVIKHQLPTEIREVLVGITFADMLKTRGIELPQATTNFISQALSYDIKARPTSFDSLLNPNNS